jgi:lipopolysaccharide/colanic/teichoic acid biosynthesis glycosyltransferase
MYQNAEKDGKVQLTHEHDDRITPVGGILRRSHIDELPQFWNVLRGDMSIVGPRAERPELIIEYQKSVPLYRARLLVKPGITGWAQINYGYTSTVAQTVVKLEYDLYYIKHRSILMDILIILRTMTQVFGFRGR